MPTRTKSQSSPRTAARYRAPRVCIDKYLPPEQAAAAGERAIAMRADNAPLLGGPTRGLALPPRMRMALLSSRKWSNGRTLRVSFLEGDPIVQQKVERFARLWEAHANLRLDFGLHANPDIRIAFDSNDGSWSYIGTDCLSISKNRSTMNFGWLEPNTDEREYERVVVHEFGHALGCIHEHQNPNGNIPWDKEKVYAYYAQQGWSRADVDTNVFEKYSHGQVNATEFDPHSIMLYAVPNEHTIGDFEVGWNTTMSAEDKEFIAAQYPKLAAQDPLIVLDGPATMASISKSGETDRFEFTVQKKKRYVVETTGKTDVVLTLLGPNDPNRWIAADDDSGLGRNARLMMTLEPGRYFVRVRHYSTGTGAYGVRLLTSG